MIITGISRNRTEAELFNFRFFFLGLTGLGVPLWVLLFPVAAVDSFLRAGGKTLPFTALVTKQFKVWCLSRPQRQQDFFSFLYRSMSTWSIPVRASLTLGQRVSFLLSFLCCADVLTSPSERMWSRRWSGLPSESSGEGYRDVNGDVCGDTILKAKWGKLEVNTGRLAILNWR